LVLVLIRGEDPMVSPYEVWEHGEHPFCLIGWLKKSLNRPDMIGGNRADFIGSAARVCEVNDDKA